MIRYFLTICFFLFGIIHAQKNPTQSTAFLLKNHARFIVQDSSVWLFLESDEIRNFVSAQTAQDGVLRRLRSGESETVFGVKNGEIFYYHRKKHAPQNRIFKLLFRAPNLYEILGAKEMPKSCNLIKENGLKIHSSGEILIELGLDSSLDSYTGADSYKSHTSKNLELFLECTK